MQANSRQKTKSSRITREEEDTNRETKMQKNVATLYMEEYEKMKKKWSILSSNSSGNNNNNNS
jgi:hypothetical protein